MQTPLFSLPSDRSEQTWRKIPPSSRPLPFHVHTLQPSYSCSLLIWPFSSTTTPSLSLLRVRKCVVVWDSPKYSLKTYTCAVKSHEKERNKETSSRLEAWGISCPHPPPRSRSPYILASINSPFPLPILPSPSGTAVFLGTGGFSRSLFFLSRNINLEDVLRVA